MEIDQSALGDARFHFPHGLRPARGLAGDAEIEGLPCLVGELGEYYDRLKKTLPADSNAEAAGATPFVRGRGGTASKRTDPMDDD